MSRWISHKRHPIEGVFDTIVIGSGMGGLATASILAKHEHKVLIVERHYEAGGYTHVFKRRGYEWDVGVHYIGQVHKPYTTASRLFRYLTENRLKWASMGDVYDKIIIDGETFPFKSGTDEFSAALKQYFPGEEKAIDAYLWYVKRMQFALNKFHGEKIMPSFIRRLAGWWMRREYLKYARLTTRDMLLSLTNNEKLIGVLTGQYGDYGLPPGQSSFAMHCMVAYHYLRGGAYPVGGASEIAKSIAPVIERAGGKIYVNAEVDEVIVRDNKAVGVRMSSGQEVFANRVVSNAGFVNTATSLLPDQVSSRAGFLDKVQHLEPSASHICLYIGLNQTAEDLGLRKANLWIYPHEDHDKAVADYQHDPNAPLPVVYISFPSAKDPAFENRYPGKATIEIITLAPYQWFAEWEGSRWKKRPAAYDEFKEWLAQRMLATLYEYVPQVQGKIDHYELSTPLSTKYFMNYQQGEIYGLAHTPQRFCDQFLQPKTPIRNFYLTGQDIVGCGVMGAAMGGVLTSSAILKKNMLGTIKKEVPKEIDEVVQDDATNKDRAKVSSD